MNQDACDSGVVSDKFAWGIVCDGMGGAPAGDIAAQTAVEIIRDRIRNAYRDNMTPVSAKYLLQSAVVAANLEILDNSIENPERIGMGSTVVACIVLKDTLVCAFVGDSRGYVAGKSGFDMITHDHSLVQ